jgi:PKD repeat protein
LEAKQLENNQFFNLMSTNFITRAIILFVLIFSSISIKPQQWVDMMLEPNANLYEITDAFEAEWGTEAYVRGKGYKQFKRWANFWETRVLEDGSFPVNSRDWSNFKNLIVGNQAKSGGVGDWQPIGPFSHVNTDSWSAGSGRVNCIVEDPNDPNTLFIGAPAGGVWKSTDAGSTWTPLGDELSVIGVSGIAIDPNNSNIIYLATGDTDGGDTYSIGVLKSIDGGASWFAAGNVAGETTELIIDPTNSNVIYLATSSGVYKSTNAGTSWNNVQSGNIRDIDMKPGSSNVIYAVSPSEFFITADNGANWSTITSGLPNTSGRLAIATTAANSSYVYVLSATTGNAFQGVYRSINSGSSFTAMNTTTDIFESTQAWYDMAIAASQTDANEIVTGVLNLWKSTNGGSSFSQLNNWSSPSASAYTHADIHYLKYYGGNLYCGSDGGIYQSTNSGNDFTDLSDGLQIGQFYRIGGSQNDVNTISGGLQDNGGYVLKAGVWKNYYGADGMEAGVDRNNSNIIFGMIQYGDLYRSTNGGNTSNGQGSPMAGRWVTPMQMDPNNNRLLAGYDDLHEFDYGSGWNQLSTFTFPNQLRCIEIYDGNSDIIFVSTDDEIYKTIDNGNNFTDITGSLPTNSVITSIEVNPSNSDELWVSRGGWDGLNHIFHTSDGGATWNNLTGNLPNLPCNIVKFDVGTNGGVYVGTDLGVYYRDEDLGSWIQYMNNLPNVIVNDLEIHEATNVIRAGTYGRGVWESPNYNAYNNDAGISGISSPDLSICNTSTFDPVVTLINYGLINLTSVDIIYDVDGSNPQTFSWAGNLVQGGTEVITLPTITSASGNHIFNAATSMPNGVIDEALNNDSKSKSFLITLAGMPITLNLATDCWGSEVSWRVLDDIGDLVVSGGPYTDNTGGDLFTEILCLSDGCYDFIINDTYGDGMFGSQYGSCSIDGDYSLSDDQANVLVQMTVVDFGNEATHNFCITGVGLIADFTSNATTICEGTTIDFSDATASGAPTSWSWVFNGATPSSSIDQNPTGIQYASSGTYSVELTVSDGVNSNTITTTSYVNVDPTPSVAVSPTDPACGLDNGEITAAGTGGTGALIYSWSNGGAGQTISDLGVGTYTVTVLDGNGCSQIASATLSNVNGPTATVNPDQTICSGDTANVNADGAGVGGSYNWDQTLGAGITHSVFPSSTTIYTVVVTDVNGCSSSVSTTINVEPSPVLVFLPSSPNICALDSVTINVFGAQNYSWDSGETSSSVTVSPSAQTIYTVTGEDGNCSSTASITVNVSPNPVVVAGADNFTVVTGESISFSNAGSNGSSYNWDFGDGGSSTLNFPSYSYANVGAYTVILYSSLGNCSGSDTIVINVDVNGFLSHEQSGAYSIYPNPVSSELHIESINKFETMKYTIIEAQGKVVLEGIYEFNSTIDVSSLAKGIYVLQLENRNKSFMQFVKE